MRWRVRSLGIPYKDLRIDGFSPVVIHLERRVTTTSFSPALRYTASARTQCVLVGVARSDEDALQNGNCERFSRKSRYILFTSLHKRCDFLNAVFDQKGYFESQHLFNLSAADSVAPGILVFTFKRNRGPGKLGLRLYTGAHRL